MSKSKISKEADNSASHKTKVVRSSYGFKVGEYVVEIKSISEQNAVAILCKHYWDLIDKCGNIELLGEAYTKAG